MMFSFLNLNVNSVTALILPKYTDKFWLIYSNLISLFLIIIFIILLGIIFLNNARHVKFLNLLSAFYLIIYFFFISLNYNYDFLNLNLSFNQNTTLFVNLFIFISTITVIIFFLGISNVFFIEENTKIEFSFLVWFIYISAIYLISSTDFISIIILLECIAFSSYVLVGFDRKNKFSATSAVKYLIIAAIPSGIFILGITLLYNNFGSFSQDYLMLILTAFTATNIFETTTIDQQFLNFWGYVNEFYFTSKNSFLVEFMTLRPTWSLEYVFMAYLLDLNSFCRVDIFQIPSQLIHLEYIIANLTNNPYFGLPSLETITKMGVESGLTKKESEDIYLEVLKNFSSQNVEYFVGYYKAYFFAYMTMIEEFNFFIHFWNLFTLPNGPSSVNFTSFKNTACFKFLYKFNFDYILGWFSALSYFEYARIVNYYGHAPNGAAVRQVLLGLQGTQEFQILNGFRVLSPFWPLKADASLLETVNFDYKRRLNLHHSTLISGVVLQEEINLSKRILTNSLNWRENFRPYHDYLQLIFMNTITLHLFEGRSFFSYQTLYNTVTDYTWLTNYFNEAKNIFYYTNSFLSLYLVLIFLLINIFFKLTAAPFHVWAPSIYGGSPLATLTFISIFSKLTIIFFTIWLFLNTFESLKSIWQPIFLLVAFLSVIFSILGAFSEKIFKRFFIYSSVGHVGFMLIGLGVLNLDGIKGTIDYLILYILSSFLIWFIVMHLTKKTATLINLKGLSFNQPFLSLIFSITIFSLSGIPPFGGFFVKYEIFYSIINSSFFYFAYLLLILTVISFFYYLRLIKIIFFENNKILVKNKNIDDIKLRIIAHCFFIIPLYMLFIDTPLALFINEILYNSLI